MMDTEALSAALRAATETVDTPPGFAEKVHRGARRRLVRRRYRISVVVLVLLAIGTGLTALSDRWLPVVSGTHDSQKPATLPSDDPRLHEPTKGDLAKDQGFLDQVRATWQRDLAVPRDLIQSSRNGTGFEFDPIGQPRVYWAGNMPSGDPTITPSAKAAVVLQSFAWQLSAGGSPPSTIVEIGVVATNPSTSELALQGQQTVGNPVKSQTSDSFAFGQDDATVLTMAESGFRVYSPGPTLDPATGKVSRKWRDLPYLDGVAVFNVEGEAALCDGRTVVELPRRPDAAHPYPANPGLAAADQPELGDGFSSYSGPDSVDPRLNWPLMTGLNGAPDGAPGTNPPSWSKVFDDALRDGGYSDLYVAHPSDIALSGTGASIGQSYWQIAYRLANGGILILGEELVGTVGELYAVTVDDSGHVLNVAYGGMIMSVDPLPVRYTLPGGDGLLLASYGSLISTPATSHRDVLVVPGGTHQVTVTSSSGHSHTVELGK
ncbi:MAG TPA: hypothetical protein VJ914_17190 [Pseudonocardiaceae bacterium]|nr:hypothetical protein [Pseudonocardiaceae bacterium]